MRLPIQLHGQQDMETFMLMPSIGQLCKCEIHTTAQAGDIKKSGPNNEAPSRLNCAVLRTVSLEWVRFAKIYF